MSKILHMPVRADHASNPDLANAAIQHCFMVRDQAVRMGCDAVRAQLSRLHEVVTLYHGMVADQSGSQEKEDVMVRLERVMSDIHLARSLLDLAGNVKAVAS